MKPALRLNTSSRRASCSSARKSCSTRSSPSAQPVSSLAWVVTPIVLITTFIFGQKVLQDGFPTLNITISADAVRVRHRRHRRSCCVSPRRKSLPRPWPVHDLYRHHDGGPARLHQHLGLPEVLGGAWIGGTVDSSAVRRRRAARPKAMYVAATIKMIQNVLIGVTAFGIAVARCTSVEDRRTRNQPDGNLAPFPQVRHRLPHRFDHLLHLQRRPRP